MGKTLASVGFAMEQYHANVPSFGEWGWTIGTPYGQPASRRIGEYSNLPILDEDVSIAQLQAAFIFSPSFERRSNSIEINTLGSHRLYRYHQQAWAKRDGVYFTETEL